MIFVVMLVLFLLFIAGLCKVSGRQEEMALEYIQKEPPKERYQYALVSNNGALIDWCWAENVIAAGNIFSRQGRFDNESTYITNLTELLKGDYYE
jgi:hypothetical protein